MDLMEILHAIDLGIDFASIKTSPKKQELLMGKNKHKIISLFVILLTILACNLPGQTVSSVSATITPNLTLTELFKPPENIATMTVDFMTSSVINDTSTPTPVPTSTLSQTATLTLTFTATPTLTNTHTATSTYTEEPGYSGCYRSGEQFFASYFNNPPIIDGVWDEWNSTQYPATYVNYGKDNWSGAEDLSSSFRVAWDEDYLYIAAKIGDDVYVQNSHGDNIYKGDSIELLLDSDLCGDYYSTELSLDDYQLGFSSGYGDVLGEKEAFLWFPRHKTGGRSDVIIASVREGTVTRAEIAIPWKMFDIQPWVGRTFGFVFSVSDNDDTTINIQQSMITSVSTRRLTNPTTWGSLILQW